MRANAAVTGAALSAGTTRLNRRQQQRPAVTPRAAAIDAVTFDGSKTDGATLELKTARAEVARGLVHKYVVMVRQNARRGTASTLTKSEVRGGGKKPFKQKGTGNARAGSSRTPLKPGGGVSFGPKPRDWTIKMNKKERRLAMATALQSAACDMIVVDDISGNVSAPGTNAFNKSLMAWGVGATEKAYVITKDANENVAKSARNIERVVQTDVTHLNVYDVLNADKVVVEASALAHIQSFFGENGQAWE